MKLAKNLNNLGTETAFSVLAEAKAKLKELGNKADNLALSNSSYPESNHKDNNINPNLKKICDYINRINPDELNPKAALDILYELKTYC